MYMHKRSTFWARTCFAGTVLMLLSLFAFSQGRTVSGKVTDANDQTGIPGVSVQVKNTSTGTITKPDGTFTLQAPENAVLIFSYVGYEQQEVPAGTGPLNIKLSASIKSLQDVVVVGYGTQKRNEVTTSVATVKAENFNQGGSRSPMDLIQGKVAGLSVTRTQGNNPNSGASIQIRGISSISGDMKPLIVIDGIPGGNLDLLQQDDIATFDVLKDGAAAAIYGTRGNNGVILITTKKGKAGDPQYTYSTYLQREAVAKRPSVLSADEYVKLAGASNDKGANTDWYDLMLDKDNLSHYHNFSASGGTANSNYRASLYYNDANGIAIENGRKQYGGRVNVNQTGLQGMLTMQFNLAGNFNKANLNGGNSGDEKFGVAGADFEQAVQRNPTLPVYDANGKFVETDAFNDYNPLARLKQEMYVRDQKTYSGDARFTLEPIRDLKFSAFGAVVRDEWNDRMYRMKESKNSVKNYQGGGYAYKGNSAALDKTFEATAEYTKTIHSDHTINALAGYSYQYSTLETYDMDNNGFLTDAFEDWNISAGNALNDPKLPRPALNSHKEDNTLIAFFGRINYNYKQKYMLQGILRHEGSSRFGANNKWGNFPAVSAGWVISKEPFMQDITVINNLKLRAGYGVTGNQGIPSYQSLITLGTGGTYLQYGKWIQTYGPDKNPNPDLKWEMKKEFNAGVDFSVLQNRISGSVDVYSRKTQDLLFNYTAQLPSNVLDNIFTNVGSISNNGVEVVINAVPLKTKNFSWNSNLAFSSQHNKLVSFSNSIYKATEQYYGSLPSPGNLGSAIRVVEGGPLGTFYGHRFAGFTDDGKWLFYKKDGTKVTARDINDDDKTTLGNGIPKYMASWGNTFRYKNFDLSVFFRGKFGFKILNLQDLYFGNKKWVPNNMLTSAIGKNNQLNDDPHFSDYYLEKGDFVKLDNITLGYNFKLQTKYIRNLRVYASGRNIATITKYTGLDPELQDTALDSGIDGRGFYPRTRSYTIGLNLGF